MQAIGSKKYIDHYSIAPVTSVNEKQLEREQYEKL